LSSHLEKFDRKGSKVVYLEHSRCYLQSVGNIKILEILEKLKWSKNKIIGATFHSEVLNYLK